MDFSVPGSDSWDTTSTQEMFIETYFHSGKDPTLNGEIEIQKKKRKSKDIESMIDSQKKKKKKASMLSLKSPSFLISESCYETRQTLSPQHGDTLNQDSFENANKFSNNFDISYQTKIKKTKKQMSKIKSSEADHREFHLPETAAILKKEKSSKKGKRKQCSSETHSKPSDIHVSKTEDSDDITIESDEDALREEIRNCKIFKKIQKNQLSNTLNKAESDNEHFSTRVNFDVVPKLNANKTSEPFIVNVKSTADEDIEQNCNQSLIRNLKSREKAKNSVLSKAWEKLRAAKFRYLNEKLYTETGDSALKYFKENPEEFHDYHCGYSLQVSKWPMNPVNKIISDLQKLKKIATIADLGCGDAKIARTLSNVTVHSFDLVALNEHVTACDISKVPLPSESVDVAIFCLSLMGVNLKEYLREAQRILKMGGILKIAEVESRIQDVDDFVKNLKCFGFTLENRNLQHKIFIFLDLKKEKKKLKNAKTPSITLRPCLYKKR